MYQTCKSVNRTLVELKFGDLRNTHTEFVPVNRTLVELK